MAIRKIYIIPNFVTTANMFCGFYSVIASIQLNFTAAAWAIVAAAVFDMLDGRVARLAKATSLFGIEYDSLSDLISFGMAPAVLLYRWELEPYGRLGILASFLFLACAALRLARFNINTAIIPKNYFQGLPTPAAAGTIATYLLFLQSAELQGATFANETIALIFALGLSSLMVSQIRFPSLKELNWRSRASFGYLLIGVLMMILIAVKPEVTLFLFAAVYIFVSLFLNMFRILFQKEKSLNPHTPEKHL